MMLTAQSCFYEVKEPKQGAFFTEVQIQVWICTNNTRLRGDASGVLLALAEIDSDFEYVRRTPSVSKADSSL